MIHDNLTSHTFMYTVFIAQNHVNTISQTTNLLLKIMVEFKIQKHTKKLDYCIQQVPT